jgi:hypothetical protein
MCRNPLARSRCRPALCEPFRTQTTPLRRSGQGQFSSRSRVGIYLRTASEALSPATLLTLISYAGETSWPSMYPSLEASGRCCRIRGPQVRSIRRRSRVLRCACARREIPRRSPKQHTIWPTRLWRKGSTSPARSWNSGTGLPRKTSIRSSTSRKNTI